MHEFVKGKQFLIYTLLDLMHKADMFFVIIGLTDRFNMHTLLEKRVISRLNSQFVYVSPVSPDEVCHYLSTSLSIDATDPSFTAHLAANTMVEYQYTHDLNVHSVFPFPSMSEYIDAFNASTFSIFGSYQIPSLARKRMLSP